jgi:hypothetical protein
MGSLIAAYPAFHAEDGRMISTGSFDSFVLHSGESSVHAYPVHASAHLLGRLNGEPGDARVEMNLRFYDEGVGGGKLGLLIAAAGEGGEGFVNLGIFDAETLAPVLPEDGRSAAAPLPNGVTVREQAIDFADTAPALRRVPALQGSLQQFMFVGRDAEGNVSVSLKPTRVPRADEGGTCIAHGDCANQGHLCLYGGCFEPFSPRGEEWSDGGWGQITVRAESLRVAEHDLEGDSWDSFGGNPDPYATLYVGEQQVGDDSDDVSNSFEAEFDAEWDTTVQTGVDVSVCFFDYDTLSADDEIGCLRNDTARITEIIRNEGGRVTVVGEGDNPTAIEEATLSFRHRGQW